MIQISDIHSVRWKALSAVPTCRLHLPHALVHPQRDDCVKVPEGAELLHAQHVIRVDVQLLETRDEMCLREREREGNGRERERARERERGRVMEES
jgi:hypothetical protein